MSPKVKSELDVKRWLHDVKKILHDVQPSSHAVQYFSTSPPLWAYFRMQR